MILLLALLAIDFGRDVAPILERHCVECHRPGEVAPFPLITYDDAKTHAKLIAKVTASRYMPPWKPVHGYGRFQGERRLTDAEIATLNRWAALGAPEGKLNLTPPPTRPSRPPPDLTMSMTAPYEITPDGPDTYRCFVVPFNSTEEHWVRLVDYQPSNRKVVHHALFFTTMSRDLPKDYPCFGTPGFLPTSSLGGWSPGNQPLELPAGTAMRLPRNSRLVMQLHFHPTGKPEVEQSRLGVYFTTAPTRHIADIGLISKAIDIPPGDAAYKVRDHFTLPVNVHAVGIIPHAHYICKDVKGWATLPNGKRVWLLWIKDWDFNWQDRYWYKEPVALPEGTRVEMEFTYDNSAANPHNPNSPPQRVTWGGGSTDEMAGLHIQVLADNEEDLPELGRYLWGKIMRMVGGRF